MAYAKTKWEDESRARRKKNAEHKNFVNFNVLAGAATAKRQCFILSNGMRCDVNS